jgi:tetratricopeptide (TPR) repeat protein
MLYLLARLVDKSLVVYEEGSGRYSLLETVRQYGAGKLRDVAEGKAVRERHLDYFLDLAEQAEPHLKRPEQVQWLERLDAEHDNLRAALGEAAAQGEAAQAGLRLAGALRWFWELRGHMTEGQEHLTRALARPDTNPTTLARAKALNAAGWLARGQGDYEAAGPLLQQSLSVYEALTDTQGVGIVLNNLGVLAQDQGDYATARMMYERSLDISRERGDRHNEANVLSNLAMVASEQGDFAASRTYNEQALAVRRTLGDRRSLAISLLNLANVIGQQGDYSRAESLYHESLALEREIGNRQGVAYALAGWVTRPTLLEITLRRVPTWKRLWAFSTNLVIGTRVPMYAAPLDMSSSSRET